MSSAALASSVWLVCRKRPLARPGWDNTVLGEMRENITLQLRDFWDAGIRGPDFVWAATGPALEAFSKHPVVKKANDPDEIMSVSDFLRDVRRMVVDFVVGRVLTHGAEDAVAGLDDVTTYYLLHRHDFGLDDAPVGGCILYALSCNLSDSALVNQHDLLAQSRNGTTREEDEGDGEDEDEGETGGGAKVRLKAWNRRLGKNLGLEGPGGRPVALIDQVHKLMHLWRAGDQARVDEYLDSRGLQRNALFHQILQALIELADAGSDERAILEALSNHAAAHGDVRAPRQARASAGRSDMITSLRLVNFKNFADETLRVGPFTLIVGANASGKSNIRDAFRFLHGIGRGYTLAEIMGGKYGAGGQMEWVPIRGAPNEVVRFRRSSRPSLGDFAVQIESVLDGQRTFYSIVVRFNPRTPEGFRVYKEELEIESTMVYSTVARPGPSHFVIVGEDDKRRISLSRAQPVLTQLLKPRFRTARYPQESELAIHASLEGIRFLELSPERMREPSIPGAATLGDSGQNLPSVLEAICADPEREDVLTAWLRELTPMDVRDFRFPRDPSGRVHLQILEGKSRTVSAYSASDGTLRFLGMLAALLGADPAGLYFFEEIDNGIHPARLSLLVDLLEITTSRGVQVVATTHSPVLLDLVNHRTFENASVVCRLEDTADAIIRLWMDYPTYRNYGSHRA